MKKDKELKKRADGRYCRKVTLPNGEPKFVYGYTLKELKENRDNLMLQYAMGATNIDKRITVQEWGLKWWKAKKEGKTGSKSQYGYSSAMNNYIFEEIGNMKLIDVKDIHLQSLINEMGEAGRSESLQKKVIITLNGMFKYAKKNGLIVGNPAGDIDVYKVPPIIRQALTPKQTEIVLVICKGLRAELAVHLTLYCGLRRGELAAVKWTDINTQYKCFIITGAVEYVGNRPKPKAPKSEAGIRIIPIPPELWDKLQSAPKTSIFIVPSAQGTQMSESSVRRLLEPVQRRLEQLFNPDEKIKPPKGMAKLPIEEKFNVTWHMFRHTYATNLDKMGLSPKTRQYLLGHSDPIITDNVYTHIQNEHLESAAKELAQIYKISTKTSLWTIKGSQEVVKPESEAPLKPEIEENINNQDN